MQKLVLKTILAISMVITIISSPTSLANDGAYYMSGNQLVPMHTTQIDVKKEILNIRREGEDIVVDVHYEMLNKGKPVSLLVGFEALPPVGDANTMPVNGGHPYMKGFTAKVNGQSVQYDIALVDTDEHWEMDAEGYRTLNLNKAKSPFYFQNGRIKQEKESTQEARYAEQTWINELYVYHFSANFKSGKNTIDHSYRFEASGSVDNRYAFDYVLTAINRWGDSVIDEFELTIDMGDLIEFNIPNSFFDSSNDWQINGVGSKYPTTSLTHNSYYADESKPSTTFAMREGNVVFKKTNFKPQGGLYLYSPQIGSYQPPFNANTHDLSLNYLAINHVREEDKLDDFSLKVLRNYPFARRGYVFSNPKLQAYYDHQPWYIEDLNYKADFTKLDKFEREYIQELDSYKNKIVLENNEHTDSISK